MMHGSINIKFMAKFVSPFANSQSDSVLVIYNTVHITVKISSTKL